MKLPTFAPVRSWGPVMFSYRFQVMTTSVESRTMMPSATFLKSLAVIVTWWLCSMRMALMPAPRLTNCLPEMTTLLLPEMTMGPEGLRPRNATDQGVDAGRGVGRGAGRGVAAGRTTGACVAATVGAAVGSAASVGVGMVAKGRAATAVAPASATVSMADATGSEAAPLATAIRPIA